MEQLKKQLQYICRASGGAAKLLPSNLTTLIASQWWIALLPFTSFFILFYFYFFRFLLHYIGSVVVSLVYETDPLCVKLMLLYFNLLIAP